MSPSPIFPADRANLKAFSPVSLLPGISFFVVTFLICRNLPQVLDIACADTRAAYEQIKSRRLPPAVSDIAGAPVSILHSILRFLHSANSNPLQPIIRFSTGRVRWTL